MLLHFLKIIGYLVCFPDSQSIPVRGLGQSAAGPRRNGPQPAGGSKKNAGFEIDDLFI
jgi:hypothetical protein